MKLKISTLFSAYLVLSTIIKEKRPLAQKGKFRVARLYDQLTPEFTRVDGERNTLIVRFGEEVNGNYHVAESSPEWPKFVAAWNEFAAIEIDVEAEKIPLADLGEDGIEAQEFLTLLEFISA